MAKNGYAWGFYGRKKELDELKRYMSINAFVSVAVIGGRGVGKTTFIDEAAESLRGRKPYIYLELPAIQEKKNDQEHSRKLGRACRGMAEQARKTGLSEAIPSAEIPSDVSAQMEFFEKSLLGFLESGAVVVLDEFQNAELLYLVDGVKSVVDKMRLGRGPRTDGKIVFAGSHQQQILEMFHSPSAPLHLRVDYFQRLYPLPAPALLEMAADQGWLGRPKRFLSAYTAFGGNPRLWRRLTLDQQGGLLPEPHDGSDISWRWDIAALHLNRIISNPNESFFNNSFVTLMEEAWTIARELGKHPGGVRWDRITGLFGGEKDRAAEKAETGFLILWDHLKIVEPTTGPVLRPLSGLGKIRLTDQAAMFELSALPHCTVSKGNAMSSLPAKAKDVMNTIEGFALEQFTREWLEWFPQLDWVERSVVSKPKRGEQLEIDVVGETRRPHAQKRCLALCSCKRNPDQHNSAKTQREFELYRELREKEVDEWDDANIRWLLVSPEWPADKPRNDSFKRIDLRAMAANLELEPKTWPLPIPGPPEPFHRPEGQPVSADNTESFDPSPGM